jgi:hypothetical protein
MPRGIGLKRGNALDERPPNLGGQKLSKRQEVEESKERLSHLTWKTPCVLQRTFLKRDIVVRDALLRIVWL